MERWLEQQPCLACKGTGKVDGNFYIVSTFPLKPRAKRTCYTCDGKGTVEVEIKVK